MRLVLAAAALVAAAPVAAGDLDQADPGLVSPVTCADTTIAKINDRYRKPIGSNPDDLSEGMLISFASGVTLVAYETSLIAKAETRGDRVQLCFLGHIRHTDGCRPDLDTRGRVYRVYDYRQRAAYTIMNSERPCGGG